MVLFSIIHTLLIIHTLYIIRIIKWTIMYYSVFITKEVATITKEVATITGQLPQGSPTQIQGALCGQFWMNFRKTSEGGEVISDPKNYVADFSVLNKHFSLLNFRKRGRAVLQSKYFCCKFLSLIRANTITRANRDHHNMG